MFSLCFVFHLPDLHTNTFWLNGIGDTETGITTDIDGETRLSPPDIGADEFAPSTPLSGTYTIGGESPDHTIGTFFILIRFLLIFRKSLTFDRIVLIIVGHLGIM